MLRDLIANQPVSTAGAELLFTIGASGRSFLVYAAPGRLARHIPDVARPLG